MLQRFCSDAGVDPEKVETQVAEINRQTGNTIPIVDEGFVKSVVAWVKVQEETLQVELDAVRRAEARSNVYLCSEVLSKEYPKQLPEARQKKLEVGLDAAVALFEKEMSLLNG